MKNLPFLALVLLAAGPSSAEVPVQPLHPGVATSPLRAGGGQKPICRSRRGRIVPCNPDFRYFGGPVIGNVKMYAVFWDVTVRTDIVTGMGDFYRTVANSEYLDWLNEYSTTGTVAAGSHAQQPGTGQVIGRGVYAGAFMLSEHARDYPACSAGELSTCITDADIGDELAWQVDHGNLPPPDASTLYLVHLPVSVAVRDLAVVGISCQSFCAYHSVATRGQNSIVYAVLPALDAPGCQAGCGSGSVFANTCASASHEIVEAITDPGVGEITAGIDYPLAWYDAGDRSRGEIGDLCGGLTDTLGKDGLTGCEPGSPGCYTIQPIFSRAVWTSDPMGHPDTPACVPARYSEEGDYSLALAPVTLHVPAGASSRPVDVVTAPTGGGDVSVELAVAQLPPGVHAELDRTTVRSGQSAHLTVSSDPGAALVKDGLVVIRGSGAQDHSAALLLQVTAPQATPPSVSFVAPANRAVLAGTARITVAAQPGSGAEIAEIVLSVDGRPLASSASTVWNTHKVADGRHTLTAMVVDTSGAAVTTSRTITVHNPGGGCSSGGSGGGFAGLLVAATAILGTRRRR